MLGNFKHVYILGDSIGGLTLTSVADGPYACIYGVTLHTGNQYQSVFFLISQK